MKAVLRLFNAIQVPNKHFGLSPNLRLEETIKNGFILSREAASYATEQNIKDIIDLVGISWEKANASFHKNWEVIKNTPQEVLWLQATVHYMTTYWFESLGIYDENKVYIPKEKLELPDLKENIDLVLIKWLTKEEILEKIVILWGSGIALMQQTIDDIMEIVELNKFDKVFISKIKNKELKARLNDYYKVIPTEPVEFLRYLVTSVTEETLLIKNHKLINKIKECNTPLHIKTLDRLLDQAPDNLASVFLRFKPIFLALKSISKNKTFFNNLRRKAKKQHKPMKVDFLNNVTANLKTSTTDISEQLKLELTKVNIFRKIRLAYALKYRTTDADAILYRVRNGKSYVKEFNSTNIFLAKKYLDITLESIVDELRDNVEWKVIHIPEYINYALPATEKQFIGNIPDGSYVSIDENMVYGIHWTNSPNYRVDIDLSQVNVGWKIGWDSNYKNNNNSVLFSWDVTDAPAPKWASELFWVKKWYVAPSLVMANYYNFNENYPVDMKVYVGVAETDDLGKNYMLNPNNIKAQTILKVEEKQNLIWFVAPSEWENRFFFTNSSLGNKISSWYDDNSKKALEYFVKSLTNPIDFREILTRAWAFIDSDKPEVLEYIDLSPENLDKNSFIDLLIKKEEW